MPKTTTESRAMRSCLPHDPMAGACIQPSKSRRSYPSLMQRLRRLPRPSMLFRALRGALLETAVPSAIAGRQGTGQATEHQQVGVRAAGWAALRRKPPVGTRRLRRLTKVSVQVLGGYGEWEVSTAWTNGWLSHDPGGLKRRDVYSERLREVLCSSIEDNTRHRHPELLVIGQTR